jgi:outer membrane lipoprotein SlyB
MGCSSRSGYQGAAVGAGVGGVAGALLDPGNHWRGGVIGGSLGAVLGGTLGEISNRAARESAYNNRPVAYTNEANSQRVVAQPQRTTQGNCRVVREKYYEYGELVREVEREVCN